MNLFETIILNIILILFPILCYVVYVFFTKTIQKKRNDLILDCALYSSIYLLLKYGINSYNDIPFILFDIPLIIAYIRKRNLSVILITIILIYYYYFTFSINIFVLLFGYFLYFIMHLLKMKYSKMDFVSLTLIIKSLVFYSRYIELDNMIDLVIVILVFYIMTKCIVNIFKNLESIMSLYTSLQRFDDDKRSKESLFKITHEIKNPIAVVKGYLDMYDTNNSNHSKKYIPIIKEEINRVLMLLEDFLCITRIKIEKEETDLSVLLDDIRNSYMLILKNKNIDFIYKDINELYMQADYNRLKQVLVNIIKNSMEAIQEKGYIKLSVSKSKNKVKIIIEDNGIGMTNEESKQIKEAFFTTKKTGTGLGIYLSNEIITSHNGSLHYKSIKNKGTKVIISLPTT